MAAKVGQRGRIRRGPGRIWGAGRREQKNNEAGQESGVVRAVRECELIVLVEKYQPNLGEYLRDMGVHVAKVRTHVEDAKYDLLMCEGGARVVILEQGVGKFTSTKTREELKDLAGMCVNDDNHNLTIFYTTKTLQGSISKKTLGKGAESIDFVEYDGIRSVVKMLQNSSEKYICEEDNFEDDTIVDPKLTLEQGMAFKPSWRVESPEGIQQKEAIMGSKGGLNTYRQMGKAIEEVSKLAGEEFSEEAIPWYR